MIVAISDGLSDIASSDNGEDEEDKDDEETELSQLSEDDEPGWVMVTISKMVQQRMESFLQKKLMLDELTQPGWEDAADYFCESDKKYGTSKLGLPAVIHPRIDDDAAASASTTFVEIMQYLDTVPWILQLPQGTSRPRSSHMRLGSGKPRTFACKNGLAPATEPDSFLIPNGKPLQLLIFYPGV